jgi:hypothetical protein
MTWRAFTVGLLCVVAVALLDPYVGFNKGYGWTTQGHFPVAAVFLLVVLTIGVNSLLKLIRRKAVLKQAELMLIWCMLLVGCAFPSNLMRFWFPVVAAPSYLARRPDIQWQDTALKEAPDSLLLTKDPRSMAAERFFEGSPEGGRVPWAQWFVPVSRWGVLMLLFYGATFFMCAILRRQWVERERLQFPLASIPLEFTQESGSEGFLPPLFRNRALVAGFLGGAGLCFLRTLPVLWGAQQPWSFAIPLNDIFDQTPLENLHLVNFRLIWMPIALAYLVPADVSLSIWFFYLLGRVEMLVASWLGSPLHYGGSGSEMILWHRMGAYITFIVGSLFLARRHLWDVIRKAFTPAPDVHDDQEPVRFRFAFWGFLACVLGAVLWFAHFGMKWWAALLYLMLLFTIQFAHTRLVSQSGIYRTAPLSAGPDMLHALGFGNLFGHTGAVLAHMQYTVMIGGNNSMLGPAAMHSFRIGDVFRKHRRLLLPILMVAVIASISASSYTCLKQAYADGAVNYTHTWASIANPKSCFDHAHQIIRRPDEVTKVRWMPLQLGVGLTALTMFMRARFYWWPLHPIGLLAFASYGVDRMWMSFFFGWLIKVAFLKAGSGRLLRNGRSFFIGFVIGDLFIFAAWSLACAATGGWIPGAGGWI